MENSPLQLITPMTPAVKRKFPTTAQIPGVVEIPNDGDSSGGSSANKMGTPNNRFVLL